MREFALPDLIYNLSRCEMYSHYPELGYWKENRPAEFAEMLTTVQRHCEDMGLPVARQIKDHVETMARPNYMLDKLSVNISAIRNTLVNEMRDYRYFEMPKDDALIYENEKPFGEKVTKAFPKAVKDVKAAAKCIALDQGTACVFHLMRAMEITVQKFATKVRRVSGSAIAIDIYKDTWGGILHKLAPVIKALPITTRHDQRRKEQLESTYASLDHVKRAWRNKTMHPRHLEYTPSQARRVYGTVKVFMETLAGEI